MEHGWNNTDKGKLKYSEKILLKCHVAHYKIQHTVAWN
jgi:hypothetical protein